MMDIDSIIARAVRSGLSLTDAEAALHAGRLYDVDTQSDGGDCAVDADSEDEALEIVAEHERENDSAAHPGGRAAWALERGWTATLAYPSPRALCWNCGKPEAVHVDGCFGEETTRLNREDHHPPNGYVQGR